MTERDDIFRTQLIALLSALNGGENRDPELRRRVGTYALRMVADARARNWADLKARADNATYDSMLEVFKVQGQSAKEAGEKTAVRAFELLAWSMIARTRDLGDLAPGVQYLDEFIDSCSTAVKRAAGRTVVRPPAKAR